MSPLEGAALSVGAALAMHDFSCGLYRGPEEIAAAAHGMAVAAHAGKFLVSRDAPEYKARLQDAYRETYTLFISIEQGLPLSEIPPDSPFLGGD